MALKRFLGKKELKKIELIQKLESNGFKKTSLGFRKIIGELDLSTVDDLISKFVHDNNITKEKLNYDRTKSKAVYENNGKEVVPRIDVPGFGSLSIRRTLVYYFLGKTCGITGEKGIKYEVHIDSRNQGKHLEIKTDKGNYLSLDHIIPLSKGGNGTFDNLQILVTEENSKKGDRTE